MQPASIFLNIQLSNSRGRSLRLWRPGGADRRSGRFSGGDSFGFAESLIVPSLTVD